MIQTTSLKRNLEAVTQQLKTGGVYYIAQAHHSFVAEHLVYLCEYHLPEAFDFLIWGHGSTTVRNAQNESAR